MVFVTKNIKWIMLISGLITCSMVFAAVDPVAGLEQTFGASIAMGPLAEIVVRGWSALITMVGASLIYGAYRPVYRPFILAFASISKIIFIALVLSFGSQFLDKALIAIVFDTVVVLLYVAYLFTAKADEQ